MSQLLPYVLITPAWNEAQFIEKTIDSVVAQTFRPVKWVIVSDGSTDGTDEIASRHAAKHDWIDLVSLPPRAHRNFAGKAAAFKVGCDRVAGLRYEVIGNLDADISFDKDYLEFLLGKFAENPKLGVTGTPYREANPVHDDRFKNPDHVPGACQLFRRRCLEEIGGYPLVKSGGIDLIALLSAQAKGWQTKRFDDKVCWHHRQVGSGQNAGLYRRLFILGRKDYLLGSHPLFEVFRCTHRMTNRPYLLGGLLMLIGYASAAVTRAEQSMPDELIKIRQADQIRRLKSMLRHPFGRKDGPNPVTVRS